nr:reverse transcriptase domain-containing protein [Tanacetum cinerariifolium]
MEKEELIVYLAASREAVSAVLMTKREAKQMAIYFVSRALQGLKINYTPMEKLVLALVHASKRLKRCFQAHPIIVITDKPIKQGPKDDSPAAPMEVNEELPDPWTVFTDGSSCIDGFGAELILTSPKRTEFTCPLRFEFDATNNEAEYEALIAEMDLFSFIHYSDPTKVRINERQIEEGQVLLLESIKGHVITLAGWNEQGGQNDNVEVARPHELNEEGGGAEVGDQAEESDHVVQDEEVNIVADKDVQAVIVDMPKRTRKKGKPPVVLVHFGRGGHTNYVFGPNLRTKHPAERSSIPPPLVITVGVATTAVAGTSFVPGAGTGLAIQSLFVDFASPSVAGSDTSGPSDPHVTKIPADTFYISQEIDSENIHMIDQLVLLGFFSNFAYEAVHDEKIKILSDRVAEIDSELMGMVVHLDEEIYPRFLTTIGGRRWIISRGFRLVVMKCLPYLEYDVTLGTAIGLAIDKGMQTGLVAGTDHGKARRGFAKIVAYDPSVEERYVFAVVALRDLDFNFLSQLESQKDARIACIMDSLRLDGPSAETLVVSRLQPATSSFYCLFTRRRTMLSLERLFSMGPLVDHLSFKNLVGEASTSRVLATTATTTALFVSITTANVSSIPTISVVDYEVLNTETSA